MARVALITSSFDPWVGGVETHVKGLATHLADGGDAVEVWSVDRGLGLGRREVDGVGVIDLPTPLPARSAGPVARFATRFPAAWLAWSRAVKQFRPDVLHVHCFGPNGLYAAALARRFRLPLVITSHGETFADAEGVFDTSALLRTGLARALTMADATTAVTPMVAQDLQHRFGASEVQIITNALDPMPPENQTPHVHASDVPLVVAVGRLEPTKGFDLLLQACALLQRDGVDHRLVIGGVGMHSQSLQDLAASLDFDVDDVFLGRLTPAEVHAWMAEADVVVMPSRVEPFGIVALEAWRAGTPLIATSRGGIRDLVVDGHDALLVDPEDTDALAECMKRVIDDPALAARLVAGGTDSLRNYTWPVVTEAYRAVYAEVSH